MTDNNLIPMPSKKQTATALEKSIEKWRKIVIGTGKDNHANNCALCQLFVEERGTCAGCPVVEATGCQGCRGTPYESWVDAVSSEAQDLGLLELLELLEGTSLDQALGHGGSFYPIGPKSLREAIREYDFLVSLRKEPL